MRAIMPVSEYRGWLLYLNNKQPDETEIQLAVLSNLVASGLGSKKSKVDNFLLNKPKQRAIQNTDPTKGMGTLDIKAAFSGLAVQMK